MSSLRRKLQRQQQKNDGTFIYKKSVARKMGCSVAELNERIAIRKQKLKALEANTDGE